MKVGVCALQGRTGHDAGRWLLEVLYEMETGDILPAICVTERGKPYFADSPLFFSISHTKKHAFCALAHCPVGIDAEEIDRPVRLKVAEKVLSPAEMQRMQDAQNPQQAFLAMWVQKEAAVKCSGEGLHGFPNNTEFSPDDPNVRLWEGCLVAIAANDPEEGVTYHAF